MTDCEISGCQICVSVTYYTRYRVVGWHIKYDAAKKCWSYDIEFQRLESELPITDALRRPRSDELDDYKEYKRLRHIARLSKNQLFRARPLEAVDDLVSSSTPNDFGPPSSEAIDYFNLPVQSTKTAENPFTRALRASLQGPTSPSRFEKLVRPPLSTPRGM